MGIAALSLRQQYLINSRNDLEFKLTVITQAKMSLSSSINDIINVGTDLDPNSPEMKTINARQQRLQLIDKQLESQMQRYQNQLKMAETELESLGKMIDGNIKRSFTYGSQ